MTISSLKKLPLDEDSFKALYTKILEIPGLRGLVWNVTSSEILEDVWRRIVKKAGTPDPFYWEKLQQNGKIMGLYPALEEMVKEAKDPLLLATKLSITGNSIDFMITNNSLGIEKAIIKRSEAPISTDEYSKFKYTLEKTKQLIIFGDNAGEIVLDKLLIETINKMHNLDVFYVVRSIPVLNDVTLEEAKSVGIDKIATVVENGIDGPLPGTILSRCSTEMRELFDKADLIISKGGGNFNTLDEEIKDLKKKITFMLLSKCESYSKNFGVELFQPIIANYY
jgi:uncharacterized protein with ATP-grasp and redox domains